MKFKINAEGSIAVLTAKLFYVFPKDVKSCFRVAVANSHCSPLTTIDLSKHAIPSIFVASADGVTAWGKFADHPTISENYRIMSKLTFDVSSSETVAPSFSCISPCNSALALCKNYFSNCVITVLAIASNLGIFPCKLNEQVPILLYRQIKANMPRSNFLKHET